MDLLHATMFALYAVLLLLVVVAACLFLLNRIEAMFTGQEMRFIEFREQFYQGEIARIAKESEVAQQEMRAVAQELIALATVVQTVAESRIRTEGVDTPA